MNTHGVLRALGQLMIVLSLAMSVVALWSALDYARGYHEERSAMRALAVGMTFGSLLGLCCWRLGRGSGKSYLGRREALLLVSLTWFLGCAVAATPYIFYGLDEAPAGHVFKRVAACYFEAVSGLTTTGATVLDDIEAMPRGLLLWRSLTQWLGGLGIVVLFVAVLPNLGVGGKRLFALETTDPARGGVRPRIGETARILWLMYLSLSLVLLLLLRFLGMGWFDSINHTLTVMPTGGFSTKNASAGHFHNAWIEWTMILFMFIAGINFGLLYRAMRHGVRELVRDPEFRLYLGLMAAASVTIALLILNRDYTSTGVDPATGEVFHIGQGIFEAMRYSTFQVVSVQTSSGFGTADWEEWDFVGKFILLLLMVPGGSAGSTAGGFKVVRLLIVIKAVLAEFERVFRPNVVRPIRLGQTPISQEVRLTTLVFFITAIAIILAGSLSLMILEADNPVLTAADREITYTTAFSSSLAAFSNIGPALHHAGPTETYSFYSNPSMMLLSVIMILGRLEIFTVLVLLAPRFWKDE